MNPSHNKFTHRKVTTTRHRYGYGDTYKEYTTTEWRCRRWFDVVQGIVAIALIIAAFAAVRFGFGVGIYAISENTCEHKAHKYGVEGWSYGLATGCNYKVDGKWIDSGKYPETFVKVTK